MQTYSNTKAPSVIEGSSEKGVSLTELSRESTVTCNKSKASTKKKQPNTALRHERDLRGWSQRRIADEIGTCADVISRWERGESKPDPYFRERLCVLFGKNAEELGFLSTSVDTQDEESRSCSGPNEQLKYYRRMHNWTQEEMADELHRLCGSKGSSRGDITANMISRWEVGKHPPSPFWREKLCDLFGVTADTLGLLQDQSLSSQSESTQGAVSLLPLDASFFGHPDFQRGVASGRETYKEARMAELVNGESAPFLVHLGVIIGMIDEAMLNAG